jgi:hypothetical protein
VGFCGGRLLDFCDLDLVYGILEYDRSTGIGFQNRNTAAMPSDGIHDGHGLEILEVRE